MSKRFMAAAAAAVLLAASPALACKGPNVQFSDDFREVDASWGSEASVVSVEDGKVKIKADANSGYNIMYSGTPFDDADICVTVTAPRDASAKNQAAGGLVFWGSDYDNFYVFEVDPVGNASLQRKLKGKYTSVIPWKATNLLKLDAPAKNVLRVTTSGNSITLWINDLKFAAVKGQVPAGGGNIGLHSESEKAKHDTWKFSELKVTDLAPAQ